MSIPIPRCLVSKAFRDETAFQLLANAVHTNSKHGAFSLLPCTCDPPCEFLSEEAIDELDDRLAETIQEIKRQEK